MDEGGRAMGFIPALLIGSKQGTRHFDLLRTFSRRWAENRDP